MAKVLDTKEIVVEFSIRFEKDTPKELHNMMVQLCDAGFNRAEAVQIVCAMIQSPIKELMTDD